MSKVSMTYQDLMALGSVCESTLSKAEELKQTNELVEVIRVFVKKQLVPLQSDFNDEVHLIRVKTAKVDDKGILLKESDGTYKYTVSGEEEKIKLLKELRKKEVEVHTRFVTNIPQNLTLEEKSYFEGIFWPLLSTTKVQNDK